MSPISQAETKPEPTLPSFRLKPTCLMTKEEKILCAETEVFEELLSIIASFGMSFVLIDEEGYTLTKKDFLSNSFIFVKLFLIKDPETDTQRTVGWFFLIRGNTGYDLISDYSDNDLCNEINDLLFPLTSAWEALI